LDAMVESLREQKVEWNAVERPAAARDRVKVDYSVKVDGKDVDGRPRENVQFIVGANDAFKELDAAVVGMTLNETRTFPAAIAEQHPDAELRGREALGEVTLKAVDEPTLPELDDAFFDEFEVVQPEDGGSRLDLFRDDVRQRMRIELHAATRRATRREVMQALDRLHDFELPKALLAAEQKVDRERWPKGLDMPDEARDALARAAEQRVRTQLVVGEIIKRESMKADDDRIEERIEEIVSGYQNPDEMRNWIWSEDEQIDRIEAAVLEDQVVDYVLSQAQVVPVSMSYQDLVSGEPMPELPEPAPVEASPERDDSGEEAATGAAVVDQPAAAEQPPAGGQPAVADATDGTSPADSAAPVELLEPAGEAVAEDATPEPATEPDEQGGERGGLLRRLRLFGRKRT